MFQDSKGVWHFRTEIESNLATGERRIVETKGKVKADARQRHETKLDEYRRKWHHPIQQITVFEGLC